MRLPIKLNRAGWPRVFGRLTLTYDDPRILAGDFSALSRHEVSAAISPLRFGTTFKTTRPKRQKQSDRFLFDLYQGTKPVILDVGASDGSTSLDLIDTLRSNFRRYYVTDLNISVRCGIADNGVVYFLDQSGACMLRASKRLLAYSDAQEANALLRLITARMLRRSGRVSRWQDVLLVQPDLTALAANDSRITITRYDMFTPWSGERPDVIKIACVLDPLHFSREQIAEALRMQGSTLAPDGRLLLVGESNNVEEFSVFRKTSSGLCLEHTQAGGTKAANYVPLSLINLDSSEAPLQRIVSA